MKMPDENTKYKICFSLGIVAILSTQWILLTCPHQFKHFHLKVFAALFFTRTVKYYWKGYEMFMIDLCYCLNWSILYQLYLDPGNRKWFDINYCLALGPIMHAILVFGNSLVLHSVEKMTWCAVHALPPLCISTFVNLSCPGRKVKCPFNHLLWTNYVDGESFHQTLPFTSQLHSLHGQYLCTFHWHILLGSCFITSWQVGISSIIMKCRNVTYSRRLEVLWPYKELWRGWVSTVNQTSQVLIFWAILLFVLLFNRSTLQNSKFSMHC